MKKMALAISLIILLTSFKNPKTDTKTITENKFQKTIPLIHHKYLYFIRVKLNNRNATLLLDTGAAASLLDINQANVYDFKYYQTSHKFSGVGGLSEGYRITNYNIDHDSTSLKVYPFGADLKQVNESFTESGMPIAGVLGSDFLRTHDAIIDYKNKVLIIYE